MSAAVLKPRPKAEEMALPAWFCLEILLRKNNYDLGVILSRNVLPSAICVTKLLDIVGNLCHVLGEPTLKKLNFQLAKRADTKAIKRPSKKPNEPVKKYSKETNAREYATANSKHYQVPFGNDANFVNHPGVAVIKIQPKSPKFLLDMRYFCNFSLVPLGIRPRSRRCAERTRQSEGRWSRPPKAALERSYIRLRIPVPRITYFGRKKKKSPDQIPDTNEGFYIDLYLRE